MILFSKRNLKKGYKKYVSKLDLKKGILKNGSLKKGKKSKKGGGNILRKGFLKNGIIKGIIKKGL